ncbi:hypothetical protein JXA12_02180 [Candidatus Woesearchaeota archaeon]|nr:hypothetical protein [Candidatus Woesearchaeota archaeon]
MNNPFSHHNKLESALRAIARAETISEDSENLVRVFTDSDGILSLLEDEEELRLLTLGQRLLYGLSQSDIRRWVLFGNLCLTHHGRLLMRTLELPTHALAGEEPVAPVMTFNDYKSFLEGKGIDVSLPENRLFPLFRAAYLAGKHERCSVCRKPWTLGAREVFFDDHFRLITVEHGSAVAGRITLKSFRNGVLRVINDADLYFPDGVTRRMESAGMLIYPLVAEYPLTLNDYLERSVMVRGDRVLSAGDTFLLRVTFNVHLCCLADQDKMGLAEQRFGLFIDKLRRSMETGEFFMRDLEVSMSA